MRTKLDELENTMTRCQRKLVKENNPVRKKHLMDEINECLEAWAMLQDKEEDTLTLA